MFARKAMICVLLVELRQFKRRNAKEWTRYDKEKWNKDTGYMWLFAL